MLAFNDGMPTWRPPCFGQVQICQQTTAIFLLPSYNLSIANIDLKYITKQCSSSLKPRQRQKQFATATPDRDRGESVLYWRVSDTEKDTDRRR